VLDDIQFDALMALLETVAELDTELEAVAPGDVFPPYNGTP